MQQGKYLTSYALARKQVIISRAESYGRASCGGLHRICGQTASRVAVYSQRGKWALFEVESCLVDIRKIGCLTACRLSRKVLDKSVPGNFACHIVPGVFTCWRIIIGSPTCRRPPAKPLKDLPRPSMRPMRCMHLLDGLCSNVATKSHVSGGTGTQPDANRLKGYICRLASPGRARPTGR